MSPSPPRWRGFLRFRAKWAWGETPAHAQCHKWGLWRRNDPFEWGGVIPLWGVMGLFTCMYLGVCHNKTGSVWRYRRVQASYGAHWSSSSRCSVLAELQARMVEFQHTVRCRGQGRRRRGGELEFKHTNIDVFGCLYWHLKGSDFEFEMTF